MYETIIGKKKLYHKTDIIINTGQNRTKSIAVNRGIKTREQSIVYYSGSKKSTQGCNTVCVSPNNCKENRRRPSMYNLHLKSNI